MKRFTFFIVTVMLLSASCALRQQTQVEPEPEKQKAAQETYDPLSLPEDRVIVPEKYPVEVALAPESTDSLIAPPGPDLLATEREEDTTTPKEVYRVQIFTSRMYAEARREQAVAEEIFNFPVHLDYEVPYYKLRVGEFKTREEAEEALPEIKTIGYHAAWVARVVTNVQEIGPGDEGEEPLLPSDSLYRELDMQDSTAAAKEDRGGR
jgi:hypothetical protein